VASLVELPLDNGKRLSTVRKPSGFHFISREHLTDEAIEIGCPPIGWRVRLCHWFFIKLHDFEVEGS
jgi:hypothetical protein